ncbi:hypothetical protein B0T21DRAFT_448650 [Apiosordaria backusii]|uniref:DUF2470 domain-containing protein n=1 Tax=Apiosordaria backusii TaxID=314023 RepID=A0AA40EM50_9PEZI|nr:hypothetical protein B0T21DRAFT_448650 [Apiosordaria backusii]
MASEELIPPSQKTRTIAHMNADHRLDLQHILQHYNSLNDHESKSPEMVDINLQFMTIKTPHTGRTHYIKFEPELASWAERRVKLVEMTRQARVGLGSEIPDSSTHSEQDEGKEVVVKEYMPPRPLDWVIFLAVLFYYFTFVTVVKMGVLEGREGVLDWVWGRFGGHEGFVWLTKTIFWPVVGIHLGEAAWLERSRLRRRFDIVVGRAREREGKRE